MQADGSGGNYNGVQVTEWLTPGFDDCPGVSACGSPGTWTLGGGGSGFTFGVFYSPVDNSFWDEHVVASTADLLGDAGLSSCSTYCSQTYSCTDGTPILGYFTIAKYFSHGDGVTTVTVVKQ